MRCSGALQHGCSEPEVARPKVFVVQPVMDVGRSALEEIADVEVHESDRMISKPDLLAGVEDADYIWMLGDTPDRRRGDGGVTSGSRASPPWRSSPTWWMWKQRRNAGFR